MDGFLGANLIGHMKTTENHVALFPHSPYIYTLRSKSNSKNAGFGPQFKNFTREAIEHLPLFPQLCCTKCTSVYAYTYVHGYLPPPPRDAPLLPGYQSSEALHLRGRGLPGGALHGRTGQQTRRGNLEVVVIVVVHGGQEGQGPAQNGSLADGQPDARGETKDSIKGQQKQQWQTQDVQEKCRGNYAISCVLLFCVRLLNVSQQPKPVCHNLLHHVRA